MLKSTLSMHSTLAPLVVIACLLGCKLKPGGGDDAPPATATPPAAAAPAAPAFDQVKAAGYLEQLGGAQSSSAESALAGMGSAVVPQLQAFMLAQDTELARVDKSKRYGVQKRIQRAISVCQRIGAPAEAALVALNSQTKDSAVRTYTCRGIFKVGGSDCPGGGR